MKYPLTQIGLLALAANCASTSFGGTPSMLDPTKQGYETKAVLTIGETIPSSTNLLNPTWGSSYTPPGILDGLGAYEKDKFTVRVFANHELLNTRGYTYNVSDGASGTFPLTGARISYFDIDKKTCTIKSGGLAYHTIYNANGVQATDNSFLANNLVGFSRFCSGSLFEAKAFGDSGLENRLYMTGEEDAGSFNPVGGAIWALDPATGSLWHVSAFGRGAWENLTELDTGTPDKIAFLLADDQDPYNADGIVGSEAAPLYLYVGTKNPAGDFLAKNGLRGGKLYVWVSDTGEILPSEFIAAGGSLEGEFVEISNATNIGQANEVGANGFDEFGYPVQRTLWTSAKAEGAFGFSRPEDVATNPANGSEAVLASTGVDTYDLLPNGNGADTFGTIYKIQVDFSGVTGAIPTSIPSRVSMIYDGDADATRALRSPDNLDWADDGYIYVQEDKAETQTAGTAEPLFGPSAVNTSEAQVVKLNPANGAVTRIAVIDRSIVLDPSSVGNALDKGAATAGNSESSGIVDVSSLFDALPGTLFLLDVQAHGINTQTTVNPDSRITNADLGEGGQLIFLKKDTALEAKIRAEIKACQKKLSLAKRKGDKNAIRKLNKKLKGLQAKLRAQM